MGSQSSRNLRYINIGVGMRVPSVFELKYRNPYTTPRQRVPGCVTFDQDEHSVARVSNHVLISHHKVHGTFAYRFRLVGEDETGANAIPIRTRSLYSDR
jgi:hypothetical protein